MIVDARTLPPGTRLDADVCVIGGGPAGITVARSLAGLSVRVALLESGGLEPDAATQELAAGESVGLPYYPLQTARLRCLGGTSAHWGGWCRPLDDNDFTTRSWVPHSGWPFGAAELSSYYDEAHRLCQLGPMSYDPAAAGLTPPRASDGPPSRARWWRPPRSSA
jgi:choline dehydrogenase-like flavoprotein